MKNQTEKRTLEDIHGDFVIAKSIGAFLTSFPPDELVGDAAYGQYAVAELFHKEVARLTDELEDWS